MRKSMVFKTHLDPYNKTYLYNSNITGAWWLILALVQTTYIKKFLLTPRKLYNLLAYT